ncbi:hypothetical protein [Lentzea terrae]|uniref:hypothetical protein n=1 Tax=Lentzea terrae TaxID=2200761 RepID=UPI000DD2BDB8|nr:hypothetical protein [Lentzea terrae]
MVRLDRLVDVLGEYGVLCCCPVSRSAELRGVVLRDATPSPQWPLRSEPERLPVGGASEIAALVGTG